jgi:hypothetical protein
MSDDIAKDVRWKVPIPNEGWQSEVELIPPKHKVHEAK